MKAAAEAPDQARAHLDRALGLFVRMRMPHAAARVHLALATALVDSDRDLAVQEAKQALRAFDELVREGKVGGAGASNFTAEQLAEALELSALEGLTRYEWVQNSFSLLDQGDA